MADEDKKERYEERRSPSLETIANTVAIAKLTVIAKRTSEDIKETSLEMKNMMQMLSQIAPVHEQIKALEGRTQNLEYEARHGIRPITLKTILSAITLITIGFGTWVTLEVFEIELNQGKHESAQVEREKNIDEEIDRINERINNEIRRSESKITKAKEELGKQINHNKNQITYVKGRIK